MCKVQTNQNQIPSGQIQQVGNEWEHNKLPRFMYCFHVFGKETASILLLVPHIFYRTSSMPQETTFTELQRGMGEQTLRKIGHLKIVRFWSVVTVVKYHDLISISIYIPCIICTCNTWYTCTYIYIYLQLIFIYILLMFQKSCTIWYV